MSGQETRRHPETPSYRCFLSDLTGFAGLRRAGPTRTAVRIPDVGGDVNRTFISKINPIQSVFISRSSLREIWFTEGYSLIR